MIVTSEGSRLLRGIGSLLLLLGVIIGAPIALIILGGNPLPSSIAWAELREALFTPDDGTILLGLVTIIGWLAWAVFALSAFAELITLLSRHRIRIRLPGLAGPQRMAAGLLVAVVTMVTAPPAVSTPPTAPAPPALILPVSTAPNEAPPVAEPTAVPAGQPGVNRGHVHHVREGDDLWTLAERYYGQGTDWRRIAMANPTVLTGGPDRLEVGWRLVIPGFDAPEEEKRTIPVRRGDTLSAIAERELGSAERWPDLYQANRSQLSDPDVLPAGIRLVLPETTTTDKPERSAKVKESKVPATPPTPQADPTPAPQPETSTVPAEASASPTPIAPEPLSHEDTDTLDLVLPALAAGGLLAAGLVEGLAWRRRVQLQARPKGRRIPSAPASAAPLATALRRRQRPLSLRTLDRATRAIAAHCRTARVPPPPLQLALVSDDQIELVMAEPTADAPVGFAVKGRSWLLDRSDAGYLTTIPGIGESPRPWPALVTLGRDDRDRPVLADLEALRLLQLDLESTDASAAVLAAMAVELSFSPWADEMILTVVGAAVRLPDALGRHNVTCTDDLNHLLDRLEQRATIQRAQDPCPVLGEQRIDPDLADPWAPEIVLIGRKLEDTQAERLSRLLDAEPPVPLAVVAVGTDTPSAWTLRGQVGQPATLAPLGLRLTPQALETEEFAAVVDLVGTTGVEETQPAPWWWTPDRQPPDPPPDNVTYLEPTLAGWGEALEAERRSMIMTAIRSGDDPMAPRHPLLRLLGPIDLQGAAGVEPPRASRQCLEYCAWLLENPGTTAQAMGTALAVAEGTRRSNMSRLRSWLGERPEGGSYLPDAYSGRITLSPEVSSDWQRVQILTSGGVNRASDTSLRAVLDLVRGAPLADAAPGQWHWAEELRTDIISCVRDVGAELAERALDAGDLTLARWAAARALVAAPGDELLLAARIRTEHLSGNTAETERLALQLAAQARSLGVDLDPHTVAVLQQAMEGQVRARLA